MRRSRLRPDPSTPPYNDRDSLRYRIRDAVPADETWLDALRRSAYAELFEATWGGWDEARHARHFSESMKRGGISVIEVDGERVGMVQLLEDRDAVEVGEIQIDPRHQNRGIGTRVLLDVISDAHDRGRDVRLGVGAENASAIKLYERLGFHAERRSATRLHMRCPARN